MQVREVMNPKAEACAPADNLSVAAGVMWRNDCGVVPVVDGERRITGIITDRDICMAAATRGRLAAQITVGEVQSGKVSTCSPGDDVRAALRVMEENQVRRLPVVDGGGALVGMLSLHDVMRRVTPTRGRGGGGVSYEDVMSVLKALCEPAAEAVGAEP
jgi:CBS domain-containing protein